MKNVCNHNNAPFCYMRDTFISACNHNSIAHAPSNLIVRMDSIDKKNKIKSIKNAQYSWHIVSRIKEYSLSISLSIYVTRKSRQYFATW